MAITYGPSGQPAASTFNYDALVATSLANYRKTLQDNISASNSFYAEVPWEAQDGGLYIAEDLMYDLAPVDTYEGYDELALTPTNGITQSQWQWSQAATPIAISEKERKQNKHRIVNLVTSKIMQAEIAMKEFYPKAFLQGSLISGGTSLTTAYTSPVNGSSFIDPLPKLVYYESASSWPTLSVGGIDQNTQSWWRNQSKASTATTATGFMGEILNMYNLCSKGPGGPPNLILCDQVTWELVHQAYRLYFNNNVSSDGNFPFPNLKFFSSRIVWDEYVPDVATGTAATTTKGSMYFLNTKFFKCVYESETNFVATDFQRPTNQDAKYKHILWMGSVVMSNRRKMGVIGNIARSLTQS
jgi:hypothetical protein